MDAAIRKIGHFYGFLLPWVDHMSSTWFQTYVALPGMNKRKRLNEKEVYFRRGRKEI
jgi:hypothetical protein